MSEKLPLIVDVKRGSTEDGPGIRTTVFFKGCPLACKWCQNPETLDPKTEIGFYPQDCIGCLDCAEACPEGAILWNAEVRLDRFKCMRCGKCTEVCPGRGLRRIGEYHEIEALLELLLRDRAFYAASDGGVTMGGGEPTLWPEYVGELLRRLKSQGIHTAMQTCGYFEYSTFREKVLPWLDLIMYDIKILDSEDHLRHTGRDNRKILENIVRLSKEDTEVIPRIPLIPGFTTSKENLAGISEFLRGSGFRKCALLPYNPLGLSKWQRLGKVGPVLPQSRIQRSEEESLRKTCSLAIA